MSRYKIVVCPDCESPWIVDGNPKRTSCSSCSKSHQLKQLRIRGEFESTSQAREAIAYVRAVLTEEKEEFEELKEKGVFSDDIIEEVNIGYTENYLREQGVNASEIESVSDDSLSQKEIKEKLLQTLERTESLSQDELVSQFSEGDRDNAEKILTRLRNEGIVIVNQGDFSLA